MFDRRGALLLVASLAALPVAAQTTAQLEARHRRLLETRQALDNEIARADLERFDRQPRRYFTVDGVVLAAGQSRRMGVPKPQLEVEPGVTLLERAIHTLREAGCRYVVAVVNDADDWKIGRAS